jgi:predicted Zn-dependent protease
MTRALILVVVCSFAAAQVGYAKPRAKGKTATPAQLVKQGEALIMVGNFEEAAKAYEQALKGDPKLVDAKVRLAHCLLRGGKTADAKKMLEEIVAEARPPAEALSLLGEIYLAEKDHAKAAGVLEKLVALRTTDLKSKSQLADCYRQMAESGNAEAKAKALALYAEIEKAATDPQMRRAAMEAALTIKYGELGKKILAAKESIAQGKEAAALQELNALAKQNPNVAYLHYLRGMAALSTAVNDRKLATEAFKKAAPGHHEAALQLGVLYYEQGELDNAIKQLQAALKKDPRYQEAHYHLGLIHQEKGDEKKAIEAFTQVMRINYNSTMSKWAQTKLQVMTGHIRSLLPGQVIDPSSEIMIGKKTCEMIERQWPVLNNPQLEARMNRIMDRLVKHSDRPKRDLRYKIVVINVPVPNALTVPSGKIYIFAGLADLIRTRMGDKDEYYAAVISHELAHTALRHGTGMIKTASSQMATSQSFTSYLQLAQLMGALSRTHEYEADQYGALYSYRAGYDPSAGIALHRKMLQHRGEIPSGLSHPQHAERIARLRDYLLELRAKVGQFNQGVKALQNREFDKAVDHLEIFLGVFPDSPSARNNLAVALHRKALMKTLVAPIFRRSTDVDPSARVKAIALRSGDEQRRNRKIDLRLLKEAVAEYQMVLRKDPTYPIAYNNFATALSDLGDLQQAKKHLLTALKLNPKYKEAYNNLAIVHAQLNDLGAAVVQLNKAISLDARYASAHFNLALVYEKQKRNADAAREWDAYVALDGKSGWATVARTRRAALKI